MKNVFVTGQPGVGKSTLIQRVLERLRQRNLSIGGFWTLESRNGSGERVGFDIIDVEGNKGVLARAGNAKKARRSFDLPPWLSRQGSPKTESGLDSLVQGAPMVGKYVVDLGDLERIALPSLNPVGKRLM